MNTINNAKETMMRIQLKIASRSSGGAPSLRCCFAYTHASVRADLASKLVADEWGHLAGRASALETKNNMKTKQAGIF